LNSSTLSLPPGLSIYRRGVLGRSDLDTVCAALEVERRELRESSLRPGERITLFPHPTLAPGIFIILEGKLLREGDPRPLGAGDTVVIDKLSEAVTFTARSYLRYLYRASRFAFNEASEAMLEELIARLARKDPHTALHAARIQRLALSIGRELELAPLETLRLSYGAYLHDIGKLEVPSEILLKPGNLTLEEWRIIMKHPIYGCEMLVHTPLANVAPIVEQHHERLDGSGYPYGLSGDEVLLESYVVAVADAYDAMTVGRPYQAARSPQQAVSEVNRYAGTLYPDEVVRAFNAALKKRLPTSQRAQLAS